MGKVSGLYSAFTINDKQKTRKQFPCLSAIVHCLLTHSHGTTMSNHRKRTWFRKPSLSLQSSDPTTIFTKPDPKEGLGSEDGQIRPHDDFHRRPAHAHQTRPHGSQEGERIAEVNGSSLIKENPLPQEGDFFCFVTLGKLKCHSCGVAEFWDCAFFFALRSYEANQQNGGGRGIALGSFEIHSPGPGFSSLLAEHE